MNRRGGRPGSRPARLPPDAEQMIAAVPKLGNRATQQRKRHAGKNNHAERRHNPPDPPLVKAKIRETLLLLFCDNDPGDQVSADHKENINTRKAT